MKYWQKRDSLILLAIVVVLVFVYVVFGNVELGAVLTG
jgi:hypothetical protein